jgi:hypothetical protein
MSICTILDFVSTCPWCNFIPNRLPMSFLKSANKCVNFSEIITVLIGVRGKDQCTSWYYCSNQINDLRDYLFVFENWTDICSKLWMKQLLNHWIGSQSSNEKHTATIVSLSGGLTPRTERTSGGCRVDGVIWRPCPGGACPGGSPPQAENSVFSHANFLPRSLIAENSEWSRSTA